MKTAVITGSFNPVTQGHIYLLEQGLKLFDKVYMVILINPDKSYALSADQRLALLREAISGYENAEAAYYDGYAVDFVKSVGADIMLRGVRDAADLGYEQWLRAENLSFGGVDTLILITDDKHRHISSTAVRQANGG